MSTDLSGTIAPTGTLRAVINLGNPILAQGTPDAPRGVTVDIAHDLAEWLDVPLQLACVMAARDSYATMLAGEVDLCFLANEPAREAGIAFTAPYVSIEGVYAVALDSPITRIEDVDRAGNRIGVRRGSAYDLFLQRSLTHAEIVLGEEPTDAFESGGVEVCAGIRQPMTEYAATAGLRVLEPPFMQINQAVGLPRSLDPAAIAAVAEHIEELKASGLVQSSLGASGVDATAAPPHNR